MEHMETIHITLPDGSVKDVPKGTTAYDVAKGFRRGLRMLRSWRKFIPATVR